MTRNIGKEQRELKYKLRPFIEAQPSKSNIKPVELDAIDLSLFREGPEFLAQRKKLAAKLENSLSTYGLFFIDRLRSIAQCILELPEEIEKKAPCWCFENRMKKLGLGL